MSEASASLIGEGYRLRFDGLVSASLMLHPLILIRLDIVCGLRPVISDHSARQSVFPS